MKKYRNVIYDLDGTLIDSFGDISRCLEEAYAAARGISKVSISKKDLGPPVRDMICNLTPGLSKKDNSRVLKKFRTLYDNCDFSGTKLYRGVRELLRTVRDSGRRQFIITNKPFLPAGRILKALDIDLFDGIITPDNACFAGSADKSAMLAYTIRKWQLAASECVVVGDGISDIAAAKANNVYCIGVLYGYSGKRELEKAGSDIVTEDVVSLRKILLSNRGGR